MSHHSAPILTLALSLALAATGSALAQTQAPAEAQAQVPAEAPAQAQVQTPTKVDAEAALALAKRNNCFKCHAIDKTKQGPAYSRVAKRLRTKPDGVEVIIEHITVGHLVQLRDGTEEKHRIVDTKDPGELRNLALWILSL
ncbi:c-type cytochrome [Rhodoferax sp.]|uniref:c-type cytochrome n=1 Tax=Rhodoferax sp. TaxID=50421 RepID=UPI0027690BCD|nr:hypothetical protein [Rhodoferax sp.]